MTSAPTPEPVWESLRFRGVYAGHTLPGQDLSTWGLPAERGFALHVWRVFRLVLHEGGAIVPEDTPVGVAAMVWTGLGWEGPFLPEWSRRASGWAEVARSVVEAALDASGWDAPRVARAVDDGDLTPSGEPWAPTLERLGMQEVTREGARSRWTLTDEAVFRRPAVSGELGVAISGGGLRATGFALGAWSVLQDEALVDRVDTLSSASGGSIFVGAWLAARARGEDEATFRATVMRFLRGERLARPAPSTSDSLIRRYADHVARELFSTNGRALRLKDLPSDKEVVFQITEMTRAGGFRLGVRREEGDDRKGARWGASGLVLSEADGIGEIRLADAVAASAAFPVGFEPFVFPRDFDLPPEVTRRVREQLVEAWTHHRWPPLGGAPPTDVPLVDGGVYDNQGIQSILRAVRRKGSELDLILVFDADGTDVMKPLLAVRPLEASLQGVGVAAAAVLLGPSALAALLPYGLYKVNGMVPPGLGLTDFLWPRRFVAAASVRAELAYKLLTDAFMRRVRGLVYDDLYAEGLPRSVAVAPVQIRDLLAHHRCHHGRPQVPLTRERLLSARYPTSPATRAAVEAAAAVPTVLRLARRASARHALARSLVVAGRATTLLALIRTTHFVPRPRHPDARRWLDALGDTWEREVGQGIAPSWVGPTASRSGEAPPEAA